LRSKHAKVIVIKPLESPVRFCKLGQQFVSF
jgi:hypothetical protein